MLVRYVVSFATKGLILRKYVKAANKSIILKPRGLHSNMWWLGFVYLHIFVTFFRPNEKSAQNTKCNCFINPNRIDNL